MKGGSSAEVSGPGVRNVQVMWPKRLMTSDKKVESRQLRGEGWRHRRRLPSAGARCSTMADSSAFRASTTALGMSGAAVWSNSVLVGVVVGTEAVSVDMRSGRAAVG